MRFCPGCQRCFHAEVQFCLYDQSPTRDVRDVPLVLEGKYRLERLIAHGGMGSVYRGLHEQLERPIAIKILRAEFLQDETIRARFHREALAAARLKHPNIIAVYDFGVLPNGGAYLVMELIEGRSLREEMRLNAARNGQMRPERAAAILRQVCAGVEAAHQAGIIHRDLKPDNIMIEPLEAHDFSGSSERVLVLDFGIAKLKQLEGAWQGLTEENVIIGTPNYISPEQCAGAPVEARSDVYALGVILYEMLTGRVPFNNVSTSAVLLSHLQDAPLPPTKYRPDLAPAVERVMLRALAKNPAHRFASTPQLAEALTRALTGTLTAPVRHDSEDIWPDELPALMPTPATPKEVVAAYGIEWQDEPATRPRQARASAVTREPYAAVACAEPSLPDGKIARRFAPAVADVEESQREMDAPQFMIEPPRRRGLWALMALCGLGAVAALAWLADKPLPRVWRDGAQSVAVSLGITSQPAPSVAPGEPVIVPAAVEASANAASATPTVEAASVASSAAVLEKEVREFYRQWAQTALDQNWAAHGQAYAPQVDYYRDGFVTRANVMARKQRVLSGLQRAYLKFATVPQVVLRERDGAPVAEITFDKTWDLLRGQARSTGKAQTLLTLQRVTALPTASAPEPKAAWQIVSERQLKLYVAPPESPSPQVALASSKPALGKPAQAKPLGRAAVKPAAKIKLARQQKVAKKTKAMRPRVVAPRPRP